MVSELQRIHHLYNRAGFGLPSGYFGNNAGLKFKKEQSRLLDEGVNDLSLSVFKENPFLKYHKLFENPDADRKAIRKEYSLDVKEGRKLFRQLNVLWMQQMVAPETMVREKLTFFWHDHFGVRTNNSYHAQVHNNLLRKHALGKYGDLLHAVARDPAMMDFLNTQQNVKRKPNENFARELFELFTLGRGHYTEEDIKNAAKAFSGWKYNRFTCEFEFFERLHDKGPKTVFGRKGSFGGEDIIELVLANKQTAKHLAAKLFQYYVSDEPDTRIINLMAERLFSTDYDMGDLLEYVFTSDWFYEDRFLNSKIKSPLELLNSLRVHFGLKYARPEALVFLQNSFDQKLFFPPSVNGWPVGREWINSSSLVQRMRLADVLTSNADLGTRFKEGLDNTDPARGLNGKLLQTGTTDWGPFEHKLTGKSPERSLEELISYLLNQQLNAETERLILNKARKEESSTKSMMVSIASLPEYQLS